MFSNYSKVLQLVIREFTFLVSKTGAIFEIVWEMRHDLHGLLRFLLRLRRILKMDPQHWILFSAYMDDGWCKMLHSDPNCVDKARFFFEILKMYRGEWIQSAKIAQLISRILEEHCNPTAKTFVLKQNQKGHLNLLSKIRRRARCKHLVYSIVKKLKEPKRMVIKPYRPRPNHLSSEPSSLLFLLYK